MQAYSDYKDSGIDWVGKIPKGWDVSKVKYVSKNFDGKRVPLSGEQRSTKSGDYPYYGANGIIDYIDDYIFDGVYILVGEDGAPFRERHKNVAHRVKGKFWVNNHAHILKISDNFNADFMFYFFNEVDYLFYIGGSTRDKLTQGDLSRIPILVPSLPEQKAIASFLDNKISKINKLVKGKKKLIELLKEQRIALINHVITKGLDKTVKLKDSGVEWIGKIPDHWTVKKLKYVGQVLFSNVDKKIIEGEKIVKSCNYVDVYKNELIDESLNFLTISATESEIAKFSILKGDVLVTKDSETAQDIAVPALVSTDLTDILCGYHLAIIKGGKNTLGDFLFRTFQSVNFNIHFEINAKGVTRFGVGADAFKTAFVTVPPLSEQKEIVKYLNEETSQIDKSIETIEKEIELLEEYKEALISEAVTGKIKVPEVQE